MSFLRDPKRLIATILAGVAGLIVLIDAGGPVPLLDLMASTIIAWAAIIAACALLVGLLSVAGHHLFRIARRSNDWGYSLILIISMVVVIISGTIIGLAVDSKGDLGYVFPQSLVEQPVRDLFRAFYQPLASSFLALLTFFSLSAALRAVRRRTPEALIIIVVALIVLIISALPTANIPMLGDSVQWVSDYLVLAGARALIIGAAIGAVIAGVRVLLGFDQPFLDR
ncbi:MAG: hypothetical protein SH847_25090 [Roseiflexaceae bacterium]|nr:hypothetical protein [Roseiflexaceae bacterium]